MQASHESNASAANESHSQTQQDTEWMDSELQEDKENLSADRNAESTATHNSPRTWLLTSALSPLAVRLIRHLLAHGDYVVACLPPHEIDDEDRGAEFSELIDEVKSQRPDRVGWRERIRGIRCDGRVVGTCSAAIAEAVSVFGRIDILLCCKSEGSQCPRFPAVDKY